MVDANCVVVSKSYGRSSGHSTVEAWSANNDQLEQFRRMGEHVRALIYNGHWQVYNFRWQVYNGITGQLQLIGRFCTKIQHIVLLNTYIDLDSMHDKVGYQFERRSSKYYLHPVFPDLLTVKITAAIVSVNSF